MPEIPEVEAFKDFIIKTSLHKKIEDVTSSAKELIKGTSFADFKKSLKNKEFTSAERKGKYLIIHTSNKPKKVVMHFGLTGGLAYEKNKDIKIKYSRVTFKFSNAFLHWTNRRKFGKVWLVKNLDEIKGLEDLGPDPFALTEKQFVKLMQQHSSKNIKAFLMDQSIIAGLGNEYSDEILFQAGIDPHRKVSDLSSAEMKKAYTKMKSVLNYFIKLRKKYLKNVGSVDYFSNEDRKHFKLTSLQAHRHIDNKCPKNKNHTLKKVTIGGRSAYYCPKDQK
jgi:formamidopyrimidine-DNA glycosylase